MMAHGPRNPPSGLLITESKLKTTVPLISVNSGSHSKPGEMTIPVFLSTITMKTGKLLPLKEKTSNGMLCGVTKTSGLQLITQLLKMSLSNALKTMTDCSQIQPVLPKTLLLNTITT